MKTYFDNSTNFLSLSAQYHTGIYGDNFKRKTYLFSALWCKFVYGMTQTVILEVVNCSSRHNSRICHSVAKHVCFNLSQLCDSDICRIQSFDDLSGIFFLFFLHKDLSCNPLCSSYNVGQHEPFILFIYSFFF